ncbi:hypothetical protein [Kribbella italica]|uniref:Uncharacterized protein n=1 Tax=Kribbella italica TaxID=1540520 RepID=A0A7W9J2Q9_9ACTN|nr:hypothetical protein [Kribbella italica]MBB5834514.1 hypothetical protein [Kribbella italica]
MAELRTDLLVEYVDEQTPEQAPPFQGVERGARRRKRQRNLLAVATVVAVATVATVVTQDVQRGAEPAAPISTPTLGVLDDGPPPAQFTFGTTLMLLQKEIPVTAVRPVPGSPSVLQVEAPRSSAPGEGCYPHTMVRILDQDATTARIAAYRYVVAPDEPGGGECSKPQTGPVKVELDLRTAIGTRRIIAGTTGDRVLLN